MLTILSQYDPTRTLTLRNLFVRQLKKRFRALRGDIRAAIIQDDCFGLGRSVQAMAGNGPGRAAFAFNTNPEKVEKFMDWLHGRIQAGVLEVTTFPQLGTGIQRQWTDQYIASAYQQGIRRARQELRGRNYDVPPIADQDSLAMTFNQPFHLDRVGLLYTRTYQELVGITSTMETQIARVLSQGMADGLGMAELARRLTNTIGSGLGVTDVLGRFIPAERRATIMARTEIIRAHHAATIQEYKNWGAAGVEVQAEWSTAGDGRVCASCAELQGRIYTLKQIENMIPRHPQCRCIALPIEKGKEQAVVSSPDPVADAFIDSEHASRYLQYKEEYKAALEEIGADRISEYSTNFRKHGVWLKDGIPQTILPEVGALMNKDKALLRMYRACDDWQNSTNYKWPTALKYTASKLENCKSKFKSARRTVDYKNVIADDDYLRIRAFNQAYMELAGIEEELLLYRGTSGQTGANMRYMLIRSDLRRTKFRMKDNVISGYTDRIKTADSFGVAQLGISIRRKFKREEIIICKDLLSGKTLRHLVENEYIVKGINEVVAIEDIKYKRADFTIKDYGERE